MIHDTRRRKKVWMLGLLGLGCVLGFGIWYFDPVSREFTTNIDFLRKEITTEPNTTLDFLSDMASIFDGARASLLAVASGGRIVHVREGIRKEEVAELFAKHLDWDTSQKLAFALAPEGRYYPGTYGISAGKNEEVMRALMQHRFEREVENRIASSTRRAISLPVILKIASLIEREAGGKSDMRLISGIIWNRTWKGMALQIDATLQYAKGNQENGWWPIIAPEDKKIDSPYNTYLYKGLPPGPIGNPSLSSLEAAVTPIKNDYLYYLADRSGVTHYSATYAEHLRKKNMFWVKFNIWF